MNTTNNAGIDYSLGLANVDKDNGIHYGVIPQNEVLQAWADSSEPEYGECKHCIDTELAFDDEPLGFSYEGDGYICTQGREDSDIFIIKSPYFTRSQFCSPCAPGAGYLMNHCPDGPRTYCFGHDWFEDGIAPYPVYSVLTGELVPMKS